MSRLGAQPHHAAVVARPRRRVNRIELLFAAVHESVVVQVFGRRQWGTIHAFDRPASEKRQGRKSRGVGHQRCSGRYGDLAPG